MTSTSISYSVIGSRALKGLFPNDSKIAQRCKTTADFDILLQEEEDYSNPKTKKIFKTIMNSSKIELHYIEPLNKYLFKNSFSDINVVSPEEERNILFTLKASHIPWDTIHKEKTIYDLFLMSERGCKIVEPLYYELHDWWTKKYGEKWRADFTKESKEFFDDAVSRENIHDQLHERVKHLQQPAFKYLQEPDQTTVWVCPIRFKETTEEMRKYVVIEEAQTLALERLLLPKIKTNQYLAYCEFIKGLIERLAPLWMTIYIIENLNYFLTYKEKFHDSTI